MSQCGDTVTEFGVSEYVGVDGVIKFEIVEKFSFAWNKKFTFTQ